MALLHIRNQSGLLHMCTCLAVLMYLDACELLSKKSVLQNTHTHNRGMWLCVHCVCGSGSSTLNCVLALPKGALMAWGAESGCGGLAGCGPPWVEPSQVSEYPWWEHPAECMGSWPGSGMVHTPDKTSDSIIRLH